MTLYRQIESIFETAANDDVAEKMSKTTFDHFYYYGVDSAKRNVLTFNLRQQLMQQEGIDWELVDQCWKSRYREMQIFAVDYLTAVNDRVTYDDAKTHIKELILNKPWIDTVDKLGYILDKIDDHRIPDLMINWSRTDERWLQRVSILHQQKRRDKINNSLLEKCILNSINSDSEVVNRAIAIALKGYSNYNPNWVAAFIFHHKNELKRDTRQFASVHINRLTRIKRRLEEDRREELERQEYDRQIRKRRKLRKRRREYLKEKRRRAEQARQATLAATQ